MKTSGKSDPPFAITEITVVEKLFGIAKSETMTISFESGMFGSIL